MKILFSVPPALAHIYPVVPLAGALQGAGHEVRVATHPEMTDAVSRLGLFAVPVGGEGFVESSKGSCEGLYERLEAALAPELAQGGTQRLPSKPFLEAFARYFSPEPTGSATTTVVEDLVAFARGWRPDLVLWDMVSFPGAVAAHASGAAHARVVLSVDDFAWARLTLVDRLRGTGEADPMAAMMEPVLRRLGIGFHEDLLLGQWTVDHSPAIRARLPLDLRYVHSRPLPFNGSAVVPPWLYEDAGRPRVALSLGAGMRSFYPDDSTIDLEALFGAAEKLGLEVVATLDGSQLRQVRRVPDNVRLIDYLPLNLLLPTCRAVIHHGGGGTMAAAVPHELPQLIWPEDSHYYQDFARYVERAGAGLVIDPHAASAPTIAEYLDRLVNDPSLKEGAAGLHRDLLSVPSPAEVVPTLQALTQEYRGRGTGPAAATAGTRGMQA
ncbi:nucleotide disphospho-sugar-binding domain-containing protein [Streptomyces cyaneofuscatus]|uniref:nucleotide disphospho-sugar-binding domain-containing protein n=1 Tax=Streptomyces cyaneofuscatus TaxID=66883 RepID=UPI003666C284